MLNEIAEKTLARLLSLGSIAITVTVLTGSVSDPVNAPKLLLLGGVAAAAFVVFLSGGVKLLGQRVSILLFSALFLTASINAIINSESPVQQNFYGTYGRNTGFLTYLFLLMVFISASVLNRKKSFNLIIIALIASGVINVIYCLYALTFGDFIKWNNPYGNILGTFGNPNFIGAFLGFFTSALIAYSLTNGVSTKFRLLTAVTTIIALFEIFRSHAIQGRVVFVAGIAIVGFYLIRSKFQSRAILFGYCSIVFIAGLISLLGALQIGPLTKFIYKTSVSLRGEYWQAGLNMARDHLFTGVGFDSYGDWFRRSRDASALILPGPDTVTNAAHNVPIDVFAFGGLPLLIPYLLLIALIIKSVIKYTIQNREYDGIFVTLTTAWLGYQIQSVISINQIGLAIWGWLLGGALLAYTSVSKSNNSGISKGSTTRPKHSSDIFSPQLIASLGAVFGLILSSPPFSADAKFQSALKSSKVENIESSLVSAYMTPTDTSRLLNAVQIFEQNKLFDLSYKYAQRAVEFNPQNFDAWKILYAVSKSTPEEKARAKIKMIELDPLNKKLSELP